MDIVILTDFHRGSYKIIGDLFANSFRGQRSVRHLPTPETSASSKDLGNKIAGTIVFHNTLGDRFVPLPECYNIALPLHEWSEYPKAWINLLNEFDEVWTITDHVRNILSRGGLTKPMYKLPPALDTENVPPKRDWSIEDLPKFLFVGEPHFRKGHHLLMQGFMKAFLKTNEARLTIKTSPSCQWESPREDIVLIKEEWSRDRLLSEYAKHDCFVSASLGEGLGLPLGESIMAELPVCTNHWGGHQSLLQQEAFIEISHREIIQPFTSDPEFYAENQKCAYSSPDAIRIGLLKFLTLNSEQKQNMTISAKENFLKTYGSEFANNNIQNRLAEIQKNLKS